ncbi:hypothetical protein BJ138DRAFT_1118496 [Hygrophoropsis aurantiaca]|uniref:Uncharacterized protein n=1 Tax=Hygrophoropsis aurantiaca TaxID=72124 RepID=A0ACB7ZX14_9AGAM|nr:hypothetical protein BJ138DRAFT_1118496 [Hygrophoropsis aurantiaca]
MSEYNIVNRTVCPPSATYGFGLTPETINSLDHILSLPSFASMSFLTDSAGNHFQCHFPPAEYAAISVLLQHGASEPWKSFPTTIESMVEWAEMFKDTAIRDRVRQWTLIYKQPQDQPMYDTVYPISLRLHGYIKDMKINRLGNWNGDVDSVPYASQTMLLSGKGNRDAWIPTLDCLNLTANFISRCLRVPLTKNNPFKNSLFLQRKIFGKKADGTQTILSRAQDPDNLLSQLPDDWVLTDELQIGVLDAQHKTQRYNDMLVSIGDFVEVAANIDVVVFSDHATGKKGLKVHLSFDHLLVLVVQPEDNPVQTQAGTTKRKAADAPATVKKKRHLLEFDVEQRIPNAIEADVTTPTTRSGADGESDVSEPMNHFSGSDDDDTGSSTYETDVSDDENSSLKDYPDALRMFV